MKFRHAAFALVGWYLMLPRIAHAQEGLLPYDPPCQVVLCRTDIDCCPHCRCERDSPDKAYGGLCKDKKSGSEASCCQRTKEDGATIFLMVPPELKSLPEADLVRTKVPERHWDKISSYYTPSDCDTARFDFMHKQAMRSSHRAPIDYQHQADYVGPRCTGPDPTGSNWLLMAPPPVYKSYERFALSDWIVQEGFATFEDCDQAKRVQNAQLGQLPASDADNLAHDECIAIDDSRLNSNSRVRDLRTE